MTQLAEDTSRIAEDKDHKKAIRRIKMLSRIWLQHKKLEDESKKAKELKKTDIIQLAKEHNIHEIQLEQDRLQFIFPISWRVANEQDLIKLIEKHRPDMLDDLAPATRNVDVGKLKKALENKSVPKSWGKRIVEKHGTPQIRQYINK